VQIKNGRHLPAIFCLEAAPVFVCIAASRSGIGLQPWLQANRDAVRSSVPQVL
jgi:hypothetical protein